MREVFPGHYEPTDVLYIDTDNQDVNDYFYMSKEIFWHFLEEHIDILILDGLLKAFLITSPVGKRFLMLKAWNEMFGQEKPMLIVHFIFLAS